VTPRHGWCTVSSFGSNLPVKLKPSYHSQFWRKFFCGCGRSYLDKIATNIPIHDTWPSGRIICLYNGSAKVGIFVLLRLRCTSRRTSFFVRIDMPHFLYISFPQARSQGGNGGNSPPIPKVALTVFRLIKLLMCKPKKYVSANQWNWLKTYSTSGFIWTWSKQCDSPIAHMFNQTLCIVWMLENSCHGWPSLEVLSSVWKLVIVKHNLIRAFSH